MAKDKVNESLEFTGSSTGFRFPLDGFLLRRFKHNVSYRRSRKSNLAK